MATEKILVVDDETSMTQYLSIALRKAGYDVTAVNSGQDALEQAMQQAQQIMQGTWSAGSPGNTP